MSEKRRCVSWFHFSALYVGLVIGMNVNGCLDSQRAASLTSRVAALEAAQVEAGR